MATDPQPPEELPSSLSEAKRLGHRYYFTGKPCKHGHVDVRLTSMRACMACLRERDRKWREANRERRREQSRKWYEANSERKSEYNRRLYEANPEHHRERVRKWREANPERARERNRKWREANPEWTREYDRKYREANPELKCENEAARRSAKLQRTPPWADKESIRLVYAEAQRLTEETGIEHHVDHVYPLRGDVVSGLHVAENLEPVSAHTNLTKYNKHPDEYYEGQDDRTQDN